MIDLDSPKNLNYMKWPLLIDDNPMVIENLNKEDNSIKGIKVVKYTSEYEDIIKDQALKEGLSTPLPDDLEQQIVKALNYEPSKKSL